MSESGTTIDVAPRGAGRRRGAPASGVGALMGWYLVAVMVTSGGAIAAPAGLTGGLFTVVELVGLAAIVLGLRHHRPATGRAWWFFAAGIGVSAITHVVWWQLKEHGLGTPVARDALPLLVHPLMALGLAALVRQRHGRSRWEGLLDAGVVGGGLAALAWVLFVERSLAHVPHNGQLAVTVTRLLLDLILLVMALRLLLTTRVHTASFALLLVAFGALLASDAATLLQIQDVYGHPAAHTGWHLWSALLGAAALHPSMARTTDLSESDEPVPSRGRLIIFTVSAFVASVLTVYAAARTTPDRWAHLLVIALIAATVSVLSVLRLGIVAAVAHRRATELNAHAAQLGRALHEQRLLQDQLSHYALHDPLTNLANRTLLQRNLERPAGGPHAPRGLLLLDLDGFKDINDSYGHPVGDELLVQVAHRLSGHVRESDTVARLGGDEFAILLEGRTAQQTTLTAERVVTALQAPFRVADRDLYLTTSIGLLPLTGAIDAADALRDVDLALYAAKSGGKNRVALYHPQLRANQLDLTRIATGLRHATQRQEFTLNYQPVIDLTNDAVIGVEALLRWTPSGGAPVSPADFIPLAEETGLIVPIGAWVLHQACVDARAWHERYGVGVAVNVSGRQLREPDFPETVLDALRRSGLPGSGLILEITETALVAAGAAETTSVIERLERLRQHGIRIAVDDFGTGYSSLSYLRQLPVDILKIDRAFTAVAGDTEQSAENAAFTRAILQLGHTLDLHTVAEGVETAEQAGALRQMDCRLAQGYHFARPMPAADLTRALASPASVRSGPAGPGPVDQGLVPTV
ncbi:diguanylate cyclase (GGDEF) domain-containing protein [Micromonospora pattaloongensis]|uniref:Diguanylate cyclase (GGDEF) domain-containing protein n=1 Tax=Micromonospora pattaloongensis TaxID=405436 RepID=A0A1H3NNX8_9ACTN|nr:GGDEF domain-containing phosphodiesterase [Micromonospora pattaloongensis]SDY90626.1 diguanylate cyclase (GGDEF) domain-containing protein [Micromonospora pattaloongensis]